MFGEHVLIIIFVLALLGDNPMQSELAGHIGLRAKFFCRVCGVKGSDAQDDGDQPGAARPPSDFNSNTSDGGSQSKQGSGNESDTAQGSGANPAAKRRRGAAESMAQMLRRVKEFMKVGGDSFCKRLSILIFFC